MGNSGYLVEHIKQKNKDGSEKITCRVEIASGKDSGKARISVKSVKNDCIVSGGAENTQGNNAGYKVIETLLQKIPLGIKK